MRRYNNLVKTQKTTAEKQSTNNRTAQNHTPLADVLFIKALIMSDRLDEKALEYHEGKRAGKTEVIPTKPYSTPEELSLAYSPGVAAPAAAINKDRWQAYRYTNKGNLVAIISNGSALLGLGNTGALSAKPVMEGKSMLFKIYADIDAFDIELAEEDPDKFIATVQDISPTFGAISLEDIKAPECFYIEERLRKLLDIPVMHDDQHGTAVIIAAALTNAAEIAGKELHNLQTVINGAGAAAIATAKMLVTIGIKRENITMLDSKGVINIARSNLTPQKALFAIEDTNINTLAQAIAGKDAFIGLSRGGLFTRDMALSMSDNPIIFALANPTPEIDYNEAKEARPDAIVATGRTDTPNQINNAIAFPHLFRGALDTLSTDINSAMQQAAVKAIASLAHEPVPDNIKKSYGTDLHFGPDYIVPKIGDCRLLPSVAKAVANAAMESGIARRKIVSWSEYEETLLCRMERETHYCHHSHHSNRQQLHKKYDTGMNKLP